MCASMEARSGRHLLGSKEPLPPLIEPQLTGLSPLGLGLDGYEEEQTPSEVVF
jgi:hypothetical protein